MPAEFHYLVRGNRSSTESAVEDQFKRKDLVSRPVIRDEYRNRYLVFESRPDFFDWYQDVPKAERCFHEVVFGYRAQRLKFDIDAPANKLDALPESVISAGFRGDDWPENLENPEVSETPEVPENLDGYLDELLPGDDDDPWDTLLAEAPAPAPAPNSSKPKSSPLPTIGEIRAAKIQTVVNMLIEAVLDELYVGYYAIEDLNPTRDDIIVTDSSGPTRAGWKYSYHAIVYPYAVINSEEAREFTARVLERLPPPVRVFVDPQVNKRIQNFRLAGSAKPGTGRYKEPTREAALLFGTAHDMAPDSLFITAPSGTRILQRVYTESTDTDHMRRNRVTLGPQNPVVQTVLELAARKGAVVGHTLRDIRGALLCFDRDAPSNCRICGEVHHKDNSLMIGVTPTEAGPEGPWPATGDVICRVTEYCRQARGAGYDLGDVVVRAEDLRGVNMERKSIVKPTGRPRISIHDQIVARVEAIRGGRANPHDIVASGFERLPEASKTVYAEPEMQPYGLTPTLAVLAQMKLGKTKAIRQYLDTNFPADGLETHVIRFVTFRQTFSRSLTEAFPDFTLYTDATGELDHIRHPRLIVQVESLHRLKMATCAEPIDVLILDEVESILAQFNSGLHRHFNAAWAMFQWMLSTARYVVCMDANLGDRTYHTLLRMRPAHPPHFHWNRYARAAADMFYFTADQGAWLEKLYMAVRNDQRVVLPTNSLGEAKAYEEALNREFPKKKIMLYSSETTPSEKARHFGDVHTYWSELDVLIYTPTCSAGVSYELEHFDVLFGYFCDVSCDAETCRQMLARVRNIRTQEHYICLRATGAALPTDVEDIRRLIYDKRAGLYRNVDDVALQFEYEADGTIRYHESDYFYLWLETVRIGNLSRNEFARRFVDQVADTGAQINVMPVDGESSIGALLLMDHREMRDDLKAIRCEAIADANVLLPDEAAQVREALQTQQDVTPENRLAYERFQLSDVYMWHGRLLGPGFVYDYMSPTVRRVYRNLCRITAGGSVRASLELIRRREADHYSFMMDTRVEGHAHINEGRDLLRDRTTYVYQSHALAIWLLRVCGFICITDKTRVHEISLESRIRSIMPRLKETLDRLVYEFEIKRPKLDRLAIEPERTRFLANILRTVNTVLRMMYGVQVRRVAKRAGGGAYYLDQNNVGKLFIFSTEPESDDTPGGARPHIPSNLHPSGVCDCVSYFLEEAYYERLEFAREADDDPCHGHEVSDFMSDLDVFLAEKFEEVSSGGGH